MNWMKRDNELYENAMAFQNRCETAYYYGGIDAAKRVLERTLTGKGKPDRYVDKAWVWMRGYEFSHGKCVKQKPALAFAA